MSSTLSEKNQLQKQRLIDMQFDTHPEHTSSATHIAIITMENDGKLCAEADKLRRFDGTITAADVKALYNEFDIKDCMGSWPLGAVNFDVVASHFNIDVPPCQVDDAVKIAIMTAKRSDDRIELLQSLDRSVYIKVDQILQALGGKWNKKERAHVFKSCNAEEAVESYLTTGKIDIQKPEKFGFFPTPEKTGRRLVDDAEITSACNVLEPNGGSGALLKLIAEIVPLNQIQTYELQPHLCDVLKSMGYKAINADFLSITPEPIYQVVVLNPPFEKQQDIDHVLHAYRFLVPGGRLNAIMSYSTVFRSNKKTTDFRNFLEEHNAQIVELEAGDFKESGTNVKTITVKLTKPVDRVVAAPTVTTMVKAVAPATPKKTTEAKKVEPSSQSKEPQVSKPSIPKLKRKLKPEDQISFEF